MSEPIVMASAFGWYVGAICKDPDCDGMIVPYNRYTEYMTQEKAQQCLDTPMEQGGVRRMKLSPFMIDDKITLIQVNSWRT